MRHEIGLILGQCAIMPFIIIFGGLNNTHASEIDELFYFGGVIMNIICNVTTTYIIRHISNKHENDGNDVEYVVVAQQETPPPIAYQM